RPASRSSPPSPSRGEGEENPSPLEGEGGGASPPGEGVSLLHPVAGAPGSPGGLLVQSLDHFAAVDGDEPAKGLLAELARLELPHAAVAERDVERVRLLRPQLRQR